MTLRLTAIPRPSILAGMKLMANEDSCAPLLDFLRGSLGRKRERILDFASRPRSRRKFLDLLYHELGDLLDPSCIVPALPEAAWRQPALRFRPPSDFGVAIASLRQAHQHLEHRELVITLDGRHGYWRDETFDDLEKLVVVRPTSAGS